MVTLTHFLPGPRSLKGTPRTHLSPLELPRRKLWSGPMSGPRVYPVPSTIKGSCFSFKSFSFNNSISNATDSRLSNWTFFSVPSVHSHCRDETPDPSSTPFPSPPPTRARHPLLCLPPSPFPERITHPSRLEPTLVEDGRSDPWVTRRRPPEKTNDKPE